jgi:uncharacterized protein
MDPRVQRGVLPSASRDQSSSLEETAHRPWPVPDRPWVMGQTWERLLFAHWAVEPAALRRVLPSGLEPDVRDGRAWVGITPFGIRGTRARGLPPPPVISRFPELNVRTYVTVGGRPGIWFLSLDAASRLAVGAARRVYRLPYFRAAMSMDADGDEVRFSSRRLHGPDARFEARYHATGPPAPPAPDTLEWFLTERYCLYTLRGRDLVRADIHHRPWPLRPASAEIAENTMAAPYGLAPAGEPLLHLADRQDVVFWRLEPVGTW